MQKISKNSTITNVIITLIIIILINLISLNLFFRFDFSKGKIYSLSDASKNVMDKLEDRVVVKAFFSKDLPPQLADIRRYTKDLLEEFKTASDGRLRFEFIDPGNEQSFKEEAREMGIPPLSVQVNQNDRFEVREVYLGLVFMYGDQKEIIPMVQTQGLEYNITRTVKKLAMIEMKKIAFYGKKPEIDPKMRRFMPNQNLDNYTNLKQMIEANYELQETDLESEISDEVSALIFAGNADSLNENQLKNIDNFLMKGKSFLIFQDKVDVELQAQMANVNKSNIWSLLKKYGISARENLVTDLECGQINVQERRGIFSIQTPIKYPLFPVANNVNKDSDITKQLDNIQFVFVSEIDTTAVLDSVKFTPLVMSSERTALIDGPYFNINFTQFKDRKYIARHTEGPKILAGLYQGMFSSAYDDKKKSHSSVVFVPDGDFISDNAGAQAPSNINFVMNSLDFLVNDPDLIKLRSREINHSPLNLAKIVDVSNYSPEDAEMKLNSVRKIVKWVNYLLPALLCIVFGLIKYRNELKRRERIKEIYE